MPRDPNTIKVQSWKSKDSSVDSAKAGGRSNSSKDRILWQSAQTLSKTSNLSAPRGGAQWIIGKSIEKSIREIPNVSPSNIWLAGSAKQRFS